MTSPPPVPEFSESESSESEYSDTHSIKEARQSAEGRIFPCPRCGADVVFHIGQQRLQCPYCAFEQDLQIDANAELVERDYHAELQRVREFRKQDLAEISGLKEVHCDACGGDVVFEGTLASTHCPYCASPIQLANIHELEIRIKPDGVLPFQIDEPRARAAITQWVQSRWFAPNDFRQQGIRGEMNGIYLPYWTYDSMTSNAYSGERGETYTVTVGSGKNRRTETRVRWYPAKGTFQRFFDDVLVIGAREMNPQLVLGMEPWPLHKTLPFTREALAGYLARTYDVPLDVGFDLAKSRMDEAIRQDVVRRIGGDRQRIHKIQSIHSAITFKLIILPIWLLSYRYHDKVYQVMINAATGQVSGERPWSIWKILFAILGGLLIAGTLYGAVMLLGGR